MQKAQGDKMINGAQPDRALFVAWQDQISRQYFPIGKLVFSKSSPMYCFRYLRGVIKAQSKGFKALPEFPHIGEEYCSNILFSVFSNRLMSSSRPDYISHLARLGLTEHADDFDILARSGGRRSTDSLELYAAPEKDADECMNTFFLVHGIRYLPDAAHQRILQLRQGDPILLMADFQNPADHQALALRTEDRFIVGYIPRFYLGDSWSLLDTCGWIEMSVGQVNPPPSPVQQRLLCRMRACWPDNFIPFNSEEYMPISSADSLSREHPAAG